MRLVDEDSPKHVHALDYNPKRMSLSGTWVEVPVCMRGTVFLKALVKYDKFLTQKFEDT